MELLSKVNDGFGYNRIFVPFHEIFVSSTYVNITKQIFLENGTKPILDTRIHHYFKKANKYSLEDQISPKKWKLKTKFFVKILKKKSTLSENPKHKQGDRVHIQDLVHAQDHGHVQDQDHVQDQNHESPILKNRSRSKMR